MGKKRTTHPAERGKAKANRREGDILDAAEERRRIRAEHVKSCDNCRRVEPYGVMHRRCEIDLGLTPLHSMFRVQTPPERPSSKTMNGIPL